MAHDDIDVGPYLTRIEREFPDLRAVPFRLPEQGMDHVAIILDETWVFRFPKLPQYIDLFPKEVRLLDYLHGRIGVPIPHYERVAKDGAFGGYKMIHGVELTAETFAGLDETVQGRVAADIAAFLTQLHTTPLDEAQRFGAHRGEPRSTVLRSQRKKYEDVIEPALDAAERAECELYFRICSTWPDRAENECLIHGDFSWWHILADPAAGIAGVIDFGDRVIADPASDFGALHIYGKAFVDRVYSQYGGPKDEGFLRRAAMAFRWLGMNEMAHGVLGTFGTKKSQHALFRNTLDVPIPD